MSESIQAKHATRLDEFRREVYAALRQGQAEHIPDNIHTAIEEASSYTELRTQVSNILSALDQTEAWAGRFWLMGALTSIAAAVSKARADLEKEVFGIEQ